MSPPSCDDVSHGDQERNEALLFITNEALLFNQSQGSRQLLIRSEY
jgi:hypothetical protein